MVLNSPGFPSLLSARQGDRFWTESLGLTIKQQSCSIMATPLPFPFLVPCWSFHLYSTNCVTYLCNVLLPPSLLHSYPPSLPPFTPTFQSLREAIQYEPEIKHDKHIISFSLYELAMIHINRDEVGTLSVDCLLGDIL